MDKSNKITFSLLLALLISLPMPAQAGWFTDLSSSRAKIVACCALGISVGWLLAKRHEARNKRDEAKKKETEQMNAKMPNSFSTKRIRAEKVTTAHTNYLAEILSDHKVQEAINTVDEASFANISAQLAIITNQWQQYGYGLYIIFDLETSEFLGFAGYHTVAIDELGTVDCFDKSKPTHDLELYGFLMPNYWRKGYGFEVAPKLIELAFNHLPFKSIIAYIEPKNQAALEFIKKLHFIEEDRVMYNNKPHILFRLNKQ